MSHQLRELSWSQVHAFRLERHHLVRRAAKKDLSRVVGEIGGVQAQVMFGRLRAKTAGESASQGGVAGRGAGAKAEVRVR